MRLILFFSLIPFALFSQMFLQANRIEAGIHSCGSFGSDIAAPAGYHPTDTEFGYLGLVFDHYYDGWESGTPPYMGDFFVPGSPEEGWGLEFNVGATAYTFNNFGLNGYCDAVMTSLVDNSTAVLKKCTWKGTATAGTNKVDVTQVYSIGFNDYFILIDVTFVNSGSGPISSLEYMRNIDPDNEVIWTGDYTTSNYVLKQPGVGGNPDTAVVCARGLIYDVPIYLMALNEDARCSVEGFSNRDPDDIYDSPIAPDVDAPSVYDEAIAIAFRLGDLEPGDSAHIVFLYAFDDKVLLNDGIFDYLTDVKENDFSDKISVFPNPVNDVVKAQFYLKEQNDLQMEIVDIFGKTVLKSSPVSYSPGNHEAEYDVSALKSGVYFLRLSGEKVLFTKKIIKVQ